MGSRTRSGMGCTGRFAMDRSLFLILSYVMTTPCAAATWCFQKGGPRKADCNRLFRMKLHMRDFSLRRLGEQIETARTQSISGAHVDFSLRRLGERIETSCTWA